MKKRKSLVELKKIIDNEMIDLNELMESLDGNENPQIKEMYAMATAEMMAYENILQYIKDGSTWQFKAMNK